TFSVQAQGSLPLSYQWQSAPPGSSTFSNIAGATASSYTTPARALSDSGSSYRVIVTNAYGSVTSNAATLTVTNSTLLQGLVGWWKLDENSGTTAADSSSNG